MATAGVLQNEFKSPHVLGAHGEIGLSATLVELNGYGECNIAIRIIDHAVVTVVSDFG